MLCISKELLTTFTALPSIIETYILSIPEEVYDIKRSEEAWTIREHIYHICNVQEMLSERIILLIKEKNPVIEPFFPQNQQGRGTLFANVSEAIGKYKTQRKAQLEYIKNIDQSVLTHEANHPEYIRYNLPIIINHMVFHEYWHMYRIEELWLTKPEYLDK